MVDSAEPSAAAARTPGWFVAAALLILACAALPFFLHAASVVTHPYEVDQFEGHDLFYAQRFARGEALYNPLPGYPYVENPYPPVHAVLLGALVRLFGPVFAPGRLLSLLCTLGMAAVVALWVHRRSGGLAAVAAVLLLLGAPSVVITAPLVKADPLGGLLGMAGLAVAAGVLGRRRLWLACLLFVLATLTKQTLVAAPAAAIVWLWFRDRRSAMRLGGGWLLAVLAAVVALSLATGGQFLLHTVVYAGTPPLQLHRLLGFFGSFFLLPALPLLLATFVLADSSLSRDLVRVYALAEVLLAATSARAGAHFNYFVAPTAAVALGFGCLLGTRLLRRSGRVRTLVWGLAAVWALGNLAVTASLDEARSPATNLPVARRVDAIVRATPSGQPLLVEMAGYALRNDRPWLVQAQTMLEVSQSLDLTELHDDCRRQRFSAIVAKAYLPELLRSCLKHSYRRVDEIKEAHSWTLGGSWSIYQPVATPPGSLSSYRLLGRLPLRTLYEGSGPPSLPRGTATEPRVVKTEPDGFMNLREEVGTCRDCSALLSVDLVADAPATVALLLGADNGVSVWLDERSVFSSGLREGQARPDAYRVELEIGPGRHRMLLRVDQLGGDWGLYARLAAVEGRLPAVVVVP
jgi:hypothetical protein